MPGRDLTSMLSARISRIERALATPGRRWTVVLGMLAIALSLHASLADPRLAWLMAPTAVAAGLVGGRRFGLATAGLAGVAHAIVDGVLGLDPAEGLGLLVRLLALGALALTGELVARLEHQRDRALVRSATEDSVTGLLNVRAFYDGLEELRRDGTPYSIVLADIAGMRRLNETYGHPMGTEAMRTLGHVLRRATKDRDLVGRLGSDEVAVALVGTDADGAMTAAQRLADRLAEEAIVLPDGTDFRVHAYYGIASFPAHAQDEVGILRAADHAKQTAKERGPDEIEVSSGE